MLYTLVLHHKLTVVVELPNTEAPVLGVAAGLAPNNEVPLVLVAVLEPNTD